MYIPEYQRPYHVLRAKPIHYAVRFHTLSPTYLSFHFNAKLKFQTCNMFTVYLFSTYKRHLVKLKLLHDFHHLRIQTQPTLFPAT